VLPGGTFGELTFDDEFAGPEIDTTRWSVEDGHQNYWPETPWRRNFKKENVYIEDGALVIRTTKEEVGFSSGVAGTGDKGQPEPFEQAFGRFEARLKFPTQEGHTPAFWLFSLGVDNVDGSGRDGMEIDIIEKAFLIDRVDINLHWDGYGEDRQIAGKVVTGAGLDDGDWHVIRLDWYPDEYVFYIDGVETWRTSAGGVSQVPEFILLSDEMGNIGWGVPGIPNPPEDAILPDYFYIDYVRVYEYVPPDGQ
jgi:beta-glucanase (GH16 family)